MYETASYAIHRAATFCDRNASVCDGAESYWGIFKEKAAVGARMLGDLVNERLTGGQPTRAVYNPDPPRRESVPAFERPQPASDTLRASDRALEWRPPVSRGNL